MRIEHDLPLPMIFMGEPLANYVKSLDCRCELASKARTKTGNELLLSLGLGAINDFIFVIKFFDPTALTSLILLVVFQI